MKTPHQKAMVELEKSFQHFARNGRWGTCSDCPQNGNGEQIPELCKYKTRNDHQLGLDSLVEQYKLATN